MEEEQPSLVARFQSTFIDMLFIIVIMMIASYVLDSFANVPDWVRISLMVGLFIAYEPLCMYLDVQSVITLKTFGLKTMLIPVVG
ncbi:MAG: hypothetical protein JWN56_1161 [Sphingobacteriales bacterium]|nr:hypothetical protein [Sphingobacteriales bacterium]